MIIQSDYLMSYFAQRALIRGKRIVTLCGSMDSDLEDSRCTQRRSIRWFLRLTSDQFQSLAGTSSFHAIEFWRSTERSAQKRKSYLVAQIYPLVFCCIGTLVLNLHYVLPCIRWVYDAFLFQHLPVELPLVSSCGSLLSVELSKNVLLSRVLLDSSRNVFIALPSKIHRWL